MSIKYNIAFRLKAQQCYRAPWYKSGGYGWGVNPDACCFSRGKFSSRGWFVCILTSRYDIGIKHKSVKGAVLSSEPTCRHTHRPAHIRFNRRQRHIFRCGKTPEAENWEFNYVTRNYVINFINFSLKQVIWKQQPFLIPPTVDSCDYYHSRLSHLRWTSGCKNTSRTRGSAGGMYVCPSEGAGTSECALTEAYWNSSGGTGS